MEYILYIHVVATILTLGYCGWRMFTPPLDYYWWAYPLVVILLILLSNLWFILWPAELITYARSRKH